MFPSSPLDPERVYAFMTRNPTDNPVRRGDVIRRGRRVLGVVLDELNRADKNVQIVVWGRAWARLGDEYGKAGEGRHRLPFGQTIGPTQPNGLTPVFVNLVGRSSSKGLV